MPRVEQRNAPASILADRPARETTPVEVAYTQCTPERPFDMTRDEQLRAWAEEQAKDPAWRDLMRRLLTPRPEMLQLPDE